MKSKKLTKSLATLFIFAFIIVSGASAQAIKTEFAVGFNRHTFSVVNDEGGALGPGIGLAETYGFSLMVMENNWTVKTGLYSHNLTTAYYFKTEDGTVGKDSFSSSLSTYRIPFMVGRELVLTNTISITPQAGFSWLTNRSADTTGTTNGSTTKTYGSGRALTVDYETVSRTVNKYKFLGEVGMDLNFQLNWIFVFKVGARYTFGLQNIEKTEVTYRVNNGPTYSGTVISNGSGWNFNIGLVIPIYN